MLLPRARGPISAEVFARLLQAPPGVGTVPMPPGWPDHFEDPLEDEDLQVTLWALYELHYKGFEDVEDEWEWDAGMLAVRRELERSFEAALRTLAEPHVRAVVGGKGDLADRLFDLTETFEGPELSAYLQRSATREQTEEFLALRSIYHPMESDPQSWAIPRLQPAIKSRLVELQFDEYGGGRPERVHQALYATTLERAGLDPAYGAYIDDVPAIVLATNNAMSLFGLHRRLTGAAMGHLGAFEATSSLPCVRYAAGLRRLGFGDDAAFYFDEHVEADAVHEQLALRGICAALALDDPSQEADIVFGAVICLALDVRFAEQLLGAWDSDANLLGPEHDGVPVPA